MQMPYKILTALLAFTGCLSIVISGQTNPVLSLSGLGLLPGYYRFFKDKPPAPKQVISGISIAILVILFIDSIFISNDYLIGVAHLTIMFQAIKSFDLKEPWDHLQVYFMALLQLIIASELTYTIIFGVIFFLFLITFVITIVYAHFMKEGKSIVRETKGFLVVITALTLLFTIIFFVSIPRVFSGLWGKGHMNSIRTTGFSGKVDFGSFGDVKLDRTVVMRVEIDGHPGNPLYFRGMSLDYFDGTSWTNTFREKSWIYKRDDMFSISTFKKENATVQKIYVEPMDNDVIFGLDNIVAIEGGGKILLKDGTGSLFMPFKKGKRFNYTVYSIGDKPIFHGNRDPYLQLPDGMEKIQQFTYDIAGKEKNNLEKAKKIERYLRENYTYSLSVSRPPDGINPIEDFLFNTKKGYCEYYATAMVLMLRSLNIPSRITTGYAGGEINEYGDYLIVRQSDAHSWVEALIDDIWIISDPTPSLSLNAPSTFTLYLDLLRMQWYRYVIAFSFSDQKEMVRSFILPLEEPAIPVLRYRGSVRIAILLVAFSMVAFAIFILLKRQKQKRYDFISDQYVILRKTLIKKGTNISLSSTPSEVAQEASKCGADGRIHEFIDLYEKRRFGGKIIRREELTKYTNLLKELIKQIKNHRLQKIN